MMAIGRLLDGAPTHGRPAAVRATDLFAAPLTLLRRLRNRREIGSLEEFNDHQLADIGLTREILRASMSEGRFTDPSGYLTEVARQSRQTARRNA